MNDMEANELKIGNIIAFEDGSTDVVRIEYLFCDEDTWFVKWTKINGDGGFNEGISILVDFKPISLTSEILEKAGFHKHNNAWVMSDYIETEYNKDFFSIWDMGEGYSLNTMQFPVALDHLHQLQNLYFALTGQELEINL